MKNHKIFSRYHLALSFILVLIALNGRAQEYVSLSTVVYRPDDTIMDWVFDHKINKDNILILFKNDSLYIDDKKFRLGKMYYTKESDDMKLESFYAYDESKIYNFDVFSSKKLGEENIKMFYLTLKQSNFRYFCIRRSEFNIN